MRCTLLRMLMILMLTLLSAASAQAQDAATKAMPPEPEQQQKLEKEVAELFPIRQARKPEEKAALAAKLLDSAKATREATPDKFVLLVQSIRLAGEGADLSLALRAIEELDRHYVVERETYMVSAVEAALAVQLPPASRLEVAKTAYSMAEKALAAEEFIASGKIASALARVASRLGDRNFVRNIDSLRKRGSTMYKEHQAVKAAIEKLEQQPTDPDLNFQVGKYYALRRGDWERGAPLLALGSDAALADLGRRELSKPATADDQVALADALWAQADKAEKEDQLALRLRAGDWYRKAAPGLSGLAGIKARQRRAEATAEANGGILYLDDLDIADSFVGHGTLGTHGKAGYDVGDGTQVIRIGGQQMVEHSLSTHPGDGRPAHVDFDLPISAASMQAVVTMAKPPDSPIIFRVLGNGKEIWRSPPVTKQWALVPCRVSLKGVTKLRLEVIATGGAGRACALWIEPHLIIAESDK